MEVIEIVYRSPLAIRRAPRPPDSPYSTHRPILDYKRFVVPKVKRSYPTLNELLSKH